MNPEDQAKLDAALLLLAKLDSAQPTTLILIGFVAVCMVLIIAGSNTFTTLRMLAVQSQFINAMTTRSVLANEQIRQSTDTQTTAMLGQTNAISAINQTGLATGAAVSAISKDLTVGLEILKLLGFDVGELAKHISSPTAATQDKVDQMADKAEQKSPTPAPEPAPAPAIPATPKVGDEIPVTGQVTGVVTLTVDTPAVPT